MPKLKSKSTFKSYMNIKPKFMFTKNLIAQLCLKIPEFKEIVLKYIQEETDLSGINYNIYLQIHMPSDEHIFLFHHKKPKFNGFIFFENNQKIDLNDIPGLQKILKRSLKKEQQIIKSDPDRKNIYNYITISIFESCLFIDPETGYGMEIIEDTERFHNVNSFIPSKNITFPKSETIDLSNFKKHWHKLKSPILKLAKHIKHYEEKPIFLPEQEQRKKFSNHEKIDYIIKLQEKGLTQQEIKDLSFLTNEVNIIDFGQDDIKLKLYMERIGNIVSVSAEPYLQDFKLNVFGIRYHLGYCHI